MGVFKQAMGAAQAQKAVKQRNVLARMFPGARLASMLGNQVGHLLSLQELLLISAHIITLMLDIRSLLPGVTL